MPIPAGAFPFFLYSGFFNLIFAHLLSNPLWWSNNSRGDSLPYVSQYREFLFESKIKEMEIRLIARGFNKAMDNQNQVNPREYSVFYIYGAQGAAQEPLRYGIK